jgi:hypothetical protein
MQHFGDKTGMGKAFGGSKFVVMIAYDNCGSTIMVAEEAVSRAAPATGNPSLAG